jgi:hypothetical protein
VPLAGVAILAFGLISLALSAGRLSRSELPAIAVAVLTGLTIASYTIVDGLGVRAAHDPYSYAGLMFALQGPVFPLIAVFRRPASRGRDRQAMRRGLLAGALSVVAYGIVLWAHSKAPLAAGAAAGAARLPGAGRHRPGDRAQQKGHRQSSSPGRQPEQAPSPRP